jgi:hypothetical protein
LIIVVWESVPTSVSGKAQVSARLLAVRHGRRVHDDAREVLEVHLVDDARVRRDDAEAVEGRRAPAEERVALLVALELELRVPRECADAAERVDLDRVVDDELDGLERVDALRVAAHPLHRVAHRREVDDRRDAGEVLEEDARGRELDLARGLGARVPLGERLDVGARDRLAVLGAEEVLEEDLVRVRKSRRGRELRLERGQARDRVGLPADGKGLLGLEGIVHEGVRGYGTAIRCAAIVRVGCSGS